MLIDSHCHLNYPDFKEDFAEVLSRAQQAGVGMLQTICTTMGEFPQLEQLAASYQHIYCTVGVHPHHADEELHVTEEQLIACARKPKVSGLGETGLDFYYNNASSHAQETLFRRHIAASLVTDVPLIIHSRDADEVTITILREYPGVRGVIHCFTGSRAFAEAALELGFYISLAGIVTFKKATDLQEIARTLPLDRLLVETDAPYLAPTPHRGKRNEPAFVEHTARFIAELKNVTTEEVMVATTANFFTLFNKAKQSDAYNG